MEAIPVCRVCLKTSLEYIDFETPFVLDDEKKEEYGETLFTYLDCFRMCTRLELTDVYDDINDIKVPQSLCDACGMELRITYDFLQKARKAHQILQEAKLNTRLQINENEGIDHEVTQLYLSESSKNECANEDHDDLEAEQINENTDEDKDCFYEGSTISNDETEEIVNQSAEEDCILEILEFETYKIMEVDTVNSDLDTSVDTQRFTKTNEANIETKYHECSICRQNIRLAIFDAHMNICSKYRSAFQCTHCSSTFSTHRSLVQHSKVHDIKPKNAIVCKICNKEIPKGQLLREHTQQAHSHFVQCGECEYKCKESRMLDHVRKSHEDHTDLFCTFCSKTFINKSMFNSHLKYHQRKEASTKSDACEICGKQFSTQPYLRQHMKVHGNKRELYQCEHCDKVYVSKTALENHLRLHKGETIECVECGKHFSRQYELSVHMRFHTRNYPFECEICGKKFAIKGHLRTHQWRHQGLKLQCEECGKLFTSTKALQEHSFVHSEMPFPCDYCGRGYPSKQKFKVHLKTTHFIELNDEELQKIRKNHVPKPLVRKKLTLVQADSVMKEVEVKSKEDGCSEDVEELLVELC